jgi:hypothetical protein
MEQFFAPLLNNGNHRMPESLINRQGPLPSPGAMTPDGRINQNTASLLPIEGAPYAYGTSARISTQTQMAFPNVVQLIIPTLFIPAAESDGLEQTDPMLAHATSDGDLVFTFRMGTCMTEYGTASQYCLAPYGFTGKAVQLLNLASVNYLLWGLQVGMRLPKGVRWRKLFGALTMNAFRGRTTALSETEVWRFLRMFIRPFGVQHGGDQQGGQHEDGSIVTHGAVDYVSAFAIEGKLRHVNNLWRDCDVHEHDDLVLALRHHAVGDLAFNLSSSVRSTRTERTPVSAESGGFFFLRPEVLEYRSFTDAPYILVGRSQKFCSQYVRSPSDSCCWDARTGVTPGAPLLLTFDPDFVESDRMFYAALEDEEEEAPPPPSSLPSSSAPPNQQDVAAPAPQHSLLLPPPAGGGRPPPPKRPRVAGPVK